MDLTAEMIRVLVARIFGDADRLQAHALLEAYGAAPHEREPIRVRAAALKLSRGRLAELERVLDHARRDYRDVLAWAEYPEELRQPTWRMTPAEQARIRAAD